MTEIFIHDNGGRPYKVDISHHVSVSIFRDDEYRHFRTWKNIESVHHGEGSILFMLHNAKKERDDGLKEFIHIDGHLITKYAFPANDSIKKYYSHIGNSNVVYSYMTTERGNIYVFDGPTLVILKNQQMTFDIEHQDSFWNWYDTHFSMSTAKRNIYIYKYTE